jgi:hypothetical protein
LLCWWPEKKTVNIHHYISMESFENGRKTRIRSSMPEGGEITFDVVFLLVCVLFFYYFLFYFTTRIDSFVEISSTSLLHLKYWSRDIIQQAGIIPSMNIYNIYCHVKLFLFACHTRSLTRFCSFYKTTHNCVVIVVK